MIFKKITETYQRFLFTLFYVKFANLITLCVRWSSNANCFNNDSRSNTVDSSLAETWHIAPVIDRAVVDRWAVCSECEPPRPIGSEAVAIEKRKWTKYFMLSSPLHLSGTATCYCSPATAAA